MPRAAGLLYQMARYQTIGWIVNGLLAFVLSFRSTARQTPMRFMSGDIWTTANEVVALAYGVIVQGPSRGPVPTGMWMTEDSAHHTVFRAPAQRGVAESLNLGRQYT